MRRFLVLTVLAAASAGMAAAGIAATGGARDEHSAADHVLLHSVDGLHQSDHRNGRAGDRR
jgi:hypothetical protein